MINIELHDSIRERYFDGDTKLINQLLIEADNGKDAVIKCAFDTIEELQKEIVKLIKDLGDIENG